MKSIISKRPASFNSVVDAIHWQSVLQKPSILVQADWQYHFKLDPKCGKCTYLSTELSETPSRCDGSQSSVKADMADRLTGHGTVLGGYVQSSFAEFEPVLTEQNGTQD